MKQILSPAERASIRSDIYAVTEDQKSDYTDPKIAAFAELVTGKSVLDLGCIDHDENNWRSKYWLHKAIKAKAKSVVGLDYYESGVKRLVESGFSIIYGDAQNFKFQEKFEVVTAGDLIEHLPNLEGFLVSVNKALETGGKFAISTPNPWCWKYCSYHLVKGKLTPVNPEHVSWFCLQTLENLGKRYGFKITAHKYFSRRPFERLVPLPARIKHTTIFVIFEKTREIAN